MSKLLSFAAGLCVACSFGAVSATATAAPAANVLVAATKVVTTPAGRVGYREVGSGSPLLLIMGLGGSMDDWAPGFVDSLAASHLVVLFDNAGVGETAKLSPPLTIAEMAGETSDLISALHLGKPAVLGWSMGGMVAQALAILHPGQVSKLVLAATQAGTGKALPIPVAAAAAAVSTNPLVVLSVLFPRAAAAAARAYVNGILAYPNFYQPPRTTIAMQGAAVEAWMEGKDSAGHHLSGIKAPTLVADGTADALNPVANARLIAGSVPGAKLLLYPGAGHAFLFQDSASFVPAVERFIG